jgi:hypothetical protein
MRPLSLATVSVLALLCTACASHRVTNSAGKAANAGGAGAEIHPGELFGLTSPDSGTATDKHSDVASKTPDGGKSAATSDAAKAPADAVPASEDTGGQTADFSKAIKDKAAAEKAEADAKAAEKNKDEVGNGAATGSDLDQIDGSDPSIGRPPSAAPGRKLT